SLDSLTDSNTQSRVKFSQGQGVYARAERGHRNSVTSEAESQRSRGSLDIDGVSGLARGANQLQRCGAAVIHSFEIQRKTHFSRQPLEQGCVQRAGVLHLE